MKGRLILAFLVVFTVCATSVQAAGPPEPPTADVNVVNTADVNVVNTESEPVPVTVTNGNNSQRTPWQGLVQILFSSGSASGNIPIPATATYLAITYINVFCGIPSPGTGISYANVGAAYGGVGYSFSIPMSYQGSRSLGGVITDYWNSGEQSLIYSEGLGVSFDVVLDDSSVNDGFCRIIMSGYSESDS